MKYIKLTPFLKNDFITEQDDSILIIDDDVISGAKIQKLDSYRIVLVNGQYCPDLSDAIPGEGIFISALSAAVSQPAFIEHFGKHIDLGKNHFAALNTALFRDGLFIEIKNKVVVDKPLHIIHIVSSNSNLFLQPRHLFVVGAHSEISIIESCVTAGGSAMEGKEVVVNNVSAIVASERSKL